MNRFLWLSVVVVAGCCLLQPIRDPDLWFHVVVGRWILAHKTLPAQDYWNVLAFGEPWRAYGWSNEIISAAIEQRFGLRGLVGLYAALAVAFVGSLAFCFGRLAGSFSRGLALGVVIAAGCYWHLSLRPQSVVWVLYAWLLLAVDGLRVHGWSWWRGLQVAVIMCVWANSHISAVFGIVSAVLLLPFRDWALVARVALCAMAGTLLTPYGGAEWLTALGYVQHPFRFGFISELRPATIRDFSTWPLLAVSAALVALLCRASQRVSRATVLLWCALVFAGLASIRFIPFALILSGALIARLLADTERGADSVEKAVLRFRIAAAALCIVLLPVAWLRVKGLWMEPVDLAVVPKQAVDYLQAKQLPNPILNSLNQGHYLIYRFSDEQGNSRLRVPIDGRTNINSPEVWQKFNASFMGGERWYELVDLTKPGTIVWSSTSPFVRLLMASKEWCLVYQDGSVSGSSILVSRQYWLSRTGDLPSLNCTAP